MGKKILKQDFDASDFAEFSRRLNAETKLLEKWSNSELLATNEQESGFELEMWLLNKDFLPASNNLLFIQQANNTLLIPEAAKSCLESNLPCHSLHEDVLVRHYERIHEVISGFHQDAQKSEQSIIAVGTLPTANADNFTEASLTNQNRYHAMNRRLFSNKSKDAKHTKVAGNQLLDVLVDNVSMVGALSSFQIHFRIGFSSFPRLYNASIAVSAPMVAMAANSPYLFGKDVWEESRIPFYEKILEGANVVDRIPRVTMGLGYIRESAMELFLENCKLYPPLLPQVMEAAEEQMLHLQLHNGMIYRWNRPVLDFDEQGNPFIRIEYRPLAAGPSAIDMLATAAFYYGITYYYTYSKIPIEREISFDQAKQNFYRAARYGLGVDILWANKEKINLRKLIIERLLPQAREGLHRLDIDKDDINYYLSIIEERVRKNTTGSQWQKEFFKKNNQDFAVLVAAYIELQQKDLPVHDWPTE